MKYLLSKLVPVSMNSTYGVIENGEVARTQRSTWVQWRGRIWRHHIEAVT